MNCIKTLKFKAAWTESGWQAPYFIELHNGKITKQYHDLTTHNGQITEINGYLVPGFRNAHSHAFQYAMAGTAEYSNAAHPNDDFWTWRQSMYELALSVGPEEVQKVATQLYRAMLRRGITHVVEFHYLHHQPTGKPYSREHELALSLIAAADEAKIHLCLVPVYYHRHSFGVPFQDGQRRFVFRDTDEYFELCDKVKKDARGARLGFGVHSLRAADVADVQLVLQYSGESVFHLHLAEQTKEITDCFAVHGVSPARLLLDSVDVDARFSLVHCTHCTADELAEIAKRGATIVLSPSTEGNLGDGFFDFASFKNADGSWCLGSDSHVGLFFPEELRWLDYQQRLKQRRRDPMFSTAHADFASYLFDSALRGGKRAFGEKVEGKYFKEGEWFSGIVLDPGHEMLRNRKLTDVLPSFVYCADVNMIKFTFAFGESIEFE